MSWTGFCFWLVVLVATATAANAQQRQIYSDPKDFDVIVDEDSFVSITLGPNFQHTGASTTFGIANQPSYGVVVLENSLDGVYTYTPFSQFSGIDSFQYSFADGVKQQVGSILIHVQGVVDDVLVDLPPEIVLFEDSGAKFNLFFDFVDDDGSESLEVIIAGIPKGIELSAGRLFSPDLDSNSFAKCSFDDQTEYSDEAIWVLQREDLSNLEATSSIGASGEFPLRIFGISREIETGAQSCTEASTILRVERVTSRPELIVDRALGHEDSVVYLNVSASLSDEASDAFELSAITISHVPPKARLLVGSAVGGGVYVLRSDEAANGVPFLPPPNFSGDVKLQVSVRSLPLDGSDLFAEAQDVLVVTVNPVPDKPMLEVQNATTLEDSAADISVNTTVTDSSEVLAGVVVRELPGGSRIVSRNARPICIAAENDDDGCESAGCSGYSVKGKGETWSCLLSAEQASVMMWQPPENFFGEISLIIDAVSVERSDALSAVSSVETTQQILSHLSNDDSVKASSSDPEETERSFGVASATVHITVLPVADGPAVVLDDASASEGEWVELPLRVSLKDPAETIVDVELSDIPFPAEISLGKKTVSAAPIVSCASNDCDFDVAHCENEGTPLLGPDPTSPPDACAGADSGDAACLADGEPERAPTGCRETGFFSVQFRDVLSAGEFTSAVDALAQGQTDDGTGHTWLRLKAPEHFSGEFDLVLRATSQQPQGQRQGQDGSQPPEDHRMLATGVARNWVTIAPVPDSPILTVPPVLKTEENRPVSLNASVSLVDTDGSEELLDVLISGLPDGSSVTISQSPSEPPSAGSVVLETPPFVVPAHAASSVWLAVPADLSGSFVVDLKAASKEKGLSGQSEATASIPLNVAAVADPPLVAIVSVSTFEDSPVPLLASVSLADTDGSEVLESIRLQVRGPAAAATAAGKAGEALEGGRTDKVFSVGSLQDDGSLIVTPEELRVLTFTPEPNVAGLYTVNLTATSREVVRDDSTIVAVAEASKNHVIPVRVFGVPDAPVIELSASVVNSTEDGGGDEGSTPIRPTAVEGEGSKGLWVVKEGEDVILSFVASLVDTDSSEALIGISLTGLPRRATVEPHRSVEREPCPDLSADSSLSDLLSEECPLEDREHGSRRLFQLSREDAERFALRLPKGYTGEFVLDMVAISREAGRVGDLAASSRDQYHFRVEPRVLDVSAIIPANSTAPEGGLLALNFSMMTPDMDGSETFVGMNVTLRSVPEGTTLVWAGIDLAPTAVVAAADHRHFLPDDPAWGSSGYPGLPLYDYLFTLPSSRMSNLFLRLPTDVSGCVNVSVVVVVEDAPSHKPAEAPFEAVTAEERFTLPLLSVPEADAPSAQLLDWPSENITLLEDHALVLRLRVSLADTDGSERLQPLVVGLPLGWNVTRAEEPPEPLNRYTDLWTVPLTSFDGNVTEGIEEVEIIPPSNFSGNITFFVNITSSEELFISRLSDALDAAGHGSAFGADLSKILVPSCNATTLPLRVEVVPVADAPLLEAPELADVSEGDKVVLPIRMQGVDPDRSEIIPLLLVDGAPSGSKLEIGSLSQGQASNGTFVVRVRDAIFNESISIVPPATWSGNFTVVMTATSYEKGSISLNARDLENVDYRNVHEATSIVATDVVVRPVSNAPTLAAVPATVLEDGDTRLVYTPALTDTDASEVLLLAVFDTLSVPHGTRVVGHTGGNTNTNTDALDALDSRDPSDAASAAVMEATVEPVETKYGGGFRYFGGSPPDSIHLAPAPHCDLDFTVSLLIASSEANLLKHDVDVLEMDLLADEHTAMRAHAAIPVTVRAVADDPILEAQGVSQEEDLSLVLPVTATVGDTDASEHLSAVRVSGAPSGAVFKAGSGVRLGDPTVQGKVFDLALTKPPLGAYLPRSMFQSLEEALGHMLLQPPVDCDTDFTLTVTVTAAEEGEEHEFNGSDVSVAEASTEVPVEVTPVLDGAALDVLPAVVEAQEDGFVSFNAVASLIDTDGSEVLRRLRISGYPLGAAVDNCTAAAEPRDVVGGVKEGTESCEILVGQDGSGFSGTGQTRTVVNVTLPADFNGEFVLSVTPVVEEREGHATVSDMGDGAVSLVRVSPVVDAPVIELPENMQLREGSVIEVPVSVSWPTNGVHGPMYRTEKVLGLFVSGCRAGCTVFPAAEVRPGEWMVHDSRIADIQADGTASVLNFTLAGAPMHDTDFVLTIRAEVLEGDDGETAELLSRMASSRSEAFTTAPVTVVAWPDPPQIVVPNNTVTLLEDTMVHVPVSVSLVDQDGSETLTRVLVTGLPAGAILATSDSSNMGDSVSADAAAVRVGGSLSQVHCEEDSCTLSAETLSSLVLLPPLHADREFRLTFTVASFEGGEESESVPSACLAAPQSCASPFVSELVSATVLFNTCPVPDPPHVTAEDMTSWEGERLRLPLRVTLVDTDGSESLQKVVIQGLPEGVAVLTPNGNVEVGNDTIITPRGSLEEVTLTAPRHLSGVFPVSIKAVAVETSAVEDDGCPVGEGSTERSFTLTILPVANSPVVASAFKSTSMLEDEPVFLNITASLVDTDGSERLEPVLVGGVPFKGQLSLGHPVPSGDVPASVDASEFEQWWSIPSTTDLKDVAFVPPPDFSGTVSLSVVATTVEVGSGSRNSSQTSINVVVKPVTDTPILSLAGHIDAVEDQTFSFGPAAMCATVDRDGSEYISGVRLLPSVSLHGLPSDGSIKPDELGSFPLRPPDNFAGDFNITVFCTVVDAGGSAATVNETVSIHVEAVADEPVITASLSTVDEDHAMLLDIRVLPVPRDSKAGQSNTSLSGVVVEVSPIGANVSAGALVSADTGYNMSVWTVPLANVSSPLSVLPPSHYSGPVAAIVRVNATESMNGDWIGAAASCEALVRPLPTPAFLEARNVTVAEGGSVPLNVSVSLRDTDGSETISYVSFTLPLRASLSPGLQISPTLWHVRPENVTDLVLQLPAYCGENFSVPIEVQTAEKSPSHASTLTKKSFSVLVTPTTATPEIRLHQPASGNEDSLIAIQLTLLSNDIDASEYFANTTVYEVPTGVQVFLSLDAPALSPDRDGRFSIPSKKSGTWFSSMFYVLPKTDFSGSFSISVEATVRDTGVANGGNQIAVDNPALPSSTTTRTVDVVVKPLADHPTLQVPDLVVGWEDEPILFGKSIIPGLNDTDGSEVLDGILLNPSPHNFALLKDVPKNDKATQRISLADVEPGTNRTCEGHCFVSLGDLSRVVILTKPHFSGSIHAEVVLVSSEIDEPSISEPTTWQRLTLPSEEQQNVEPPCMQAVQPVVRNMKPSSTVIYGQLKSPQCGWARATVPVNVTSVLDEPNLSFFSHEKQKDGDRTPVSRVFGAEGKPVQFHLAAGSPDLDFSERIERLDISYPDTVNCSLNANGVPGHLAAPEVVGGTRWYRLLASVDPDKRPPVVRTDISLACPLRYAANFTVHAAVTVVDQDTNHSSTVSDDLAVEMEAFPDGVVFKMLEQYTTWEDEPFVLSNITLELKDTDGSEEFLPIEWRYVHPGTHFSHFESRLFNQSEDGRAGGVFDVVYVAAEDMLAADFVITPPKDSDVGNNVVVIASAKETCEACNKTVNQTVGLELKPFGALDDPIVTITNSSGAEDSAIKLNITIEVFDEDNTEHFQILLSALPTFHYPNTTIKDRANGLLYYSLFDDPQKRAMVESGEEEASPDEDFTTTKGKRGTMHDVMIEPPANWAGGATFEVAVMVSEDAVREDNKERVARGRNTTNAMITLSVEAVADAGWVDAYPRKGMAGVWLPLSGRVGLGPDRDGSERLSARIHVPEEFEVGMQIKSSHLLITNETLSLHTANSSESSSTNTTQDEYALLRSPAAGALYALPLLSKSQAGGGMIYEVPAAALPRLAVRAPLCFSGSSNVTIEAYSVETLNGDVASANATVSLTFVPSPLCPPSETQAAPGTVNADDSNSEDLLGGSRGIPGCTVGDTLDECELEALAGADIVHWREKRLRGRLVEPGAEDTTAHVSLSMSLPDLMLHPDYDIVDLLVLGVPEGTGLDNKFEPWGDGVDGQLRKRSFHLTGQALADLRAAYLQEGAELDVPIFISPPANFGGGMFMDVVLRLRDARDDSYADVKTGLLVQFRDVPDGPTLSVDFSVRTENETHITLQYPTFAVLADTDGSEQFLMIEEIRGKPNAVAFETSKNALGYLDLLLTIPHSVFNPQREYLLMQPVVASVEINTGENKTQDDQLVVVRPVPIPRMVPRFAGEAGPDLTTSGWSQCYGWHNSGDTAAPSLKQLVGTCRATTKVMFAALVSDTVRGAGLPLVSEPSYSWVMHEVDVENRTIEALYPPVAEGFMAMMPQYQRKPEYVCKPMNQEYELCFSKHYMALRLDGETVFQVPIDNGDPTVNPHINFARGHPKKYRLPRPRRDEEGKYVGNKYFIYVGSPPPSELRMDHVSAMTAILNPTNTSGQFYQVHMGTGEDGPMEQMTTGDDPQVTMSGLRPDTTYRFQTRNMNTVAAGRTSEEITIHTLNLTRSLSFDRRNSSAILIRDKEEYCNKSLSIEFWFRPHAPHPDQHVLIYDMLDDSRFLGIREDYVTLGYENVLLRSKEPLQIDQWHHIVYAHNNETLGCLYLNGEEQDCQEFKLSRPTAKGKLMSVSDRGSHGVTGKITLLRIWNEMLSQNNVQQVMEAGNAVGKNHANVVGYWPMVDNSDRIALDLSRVKNHAEVLRAKPSKDSPYVPMASEEEDV